MTKKPKLFFIVTLIIPLFCALECVPELQNLAFLPSLAESEEDLCGFPNDVFDPFSAAVKCLQEKQQTNEYAEAIIDHFEAFEGSCNQNSGYHFEDSMKLSVDTMKYLTQKGANPIGQVVFFDCSFQSPFGIGTQEKPFEDLSGFFFAFENYFEGFLAEEEIYLLYLESQDDCEYHAPEGFIEGSFDYFGRANTFEISSWPGDAQMDINDTTNKQLGFIGQKKAVINCPGGCYSLQQVSILELHDLELHLVPSLRIPFFLETQEKVLRMYNIDITGSTVSDVFPNLQNYVELIFENIEVRDCKFNALILNENLHQYSNSPIIFHNITITRSFLTSFLNQTTYYSSGLTTELENILIVNSTIKESFLTQTFTQYRGFIQNDGVESFVSMIDISLVNFTVSNSIVEGPQLIKILETGQLEKKPPTESIFTELMLRWRKASTQADMDTLALLSFLEIGGSSDSCGGFRRLEEEIQINEGDPDFEDFFIMKNITISHSKFAGSFISVNVTPAEPEILDFKVHDSQFGEAVVWIDQDFMDLLNKINEHNLKKMAKTFPVDSELQVRNMSVADLTISNSTFPNLIFYDDRCLLDLELSDIKVDGQSSFDTLLLIHTETAPFADRFPWIPKEPTRLTITNSVFSNHFEFVDWDAGINSFSDGVIEINVENLEFNDFEFSSENDSAPISLWFPAQWVPMINFKGIKANNLKANNEIRSLFYFSRFAVPGQEAHLDQMELNSLSNVTLFGSFGVFSVIEFTNSVFRHINVLFETVGSSHVSFRNSSFEGSADDQYEKRLGAIIKIKEASRIDFENVRIDELCQLGVFALLNDVYSGITISNLTYLVSEDCKDMMPALFDVENAALVYLKKAFVASKNPEEKFLTMKILDFSKNDELIMGNNLVIDDLTIQNVVIEGYLIQNEISEMTRVVRVSNVSVLGVEADFKQFNMNVGLLNTRFMSSSIGNQKYGASIEISNIHIEKSEFKNFNRCLRGFIFMDVPPTNNLSFSMKDVTVESFETICELLTLDATPKNSRISDITISNTNLISLSAFGFVVSAYGCQNVEVSNIHLSSSNVTGLVEFKGDCLESFNGSIHNVHFDKHSSTYHSAIVYTPQQSKQYGTYQLKISSVFFDDTYTFSQEEEKSQSLFFLMKDYSLDEDKVPVNIQILDITGIVRSSSFLQIDSHANITIDSLLFHPSVPDNRLLTIQCKTLTMRNIEIETFFKECYDSELISIFAFETLIENIAIRNVCFGLDNTVLLKGSPDHGFNWDNTIDTLFEVKGIRMSNITAGELIRVYSEGYENVLIKDFEFENSFVLRGINMREIEFHFDDLVSARELTKKETNDIVQIERGSFKNSMFLESVIVADSVKLIKNLSLDSILIEGNHCLNALIYVNIEYGTFTNIDFFNNTVIYGPAISMKGTWKEENISYSPENNFYYSAIYPDQSGPEKLVYKKSDFRIFYSPRQLYINESYWKHQNKEIQAIVDCPLIGNSSEMLYTTGSEASDPNHETHTKDNFSSFFLKVFNKIKKSCKINDLYLWEYKQNEQINLEYIPFLRFTNDYYLGLFDITGENQLFLSSNDAYLKLDIQIFDVVYSMEESIGDTLVDIGDLFEDELSVAFLKYENSLESIAHFSLYDEEAFPTLNLTLVIDDQQVRMEEFNVELIPCPDGYRITVSGACQPCFTNDFSISDLMQFDPSRTNSFSSFSADDFKYGDCKACPDGAECGDGLLQLRSHHWRTSRRSFVFFECQMSNACTGENITESDFNKVFVPLDSKVGESQNLNKNCKEGHIGAYCNACDTDGITTQNGTRYLKSKMGNCIECHSDWVGWFSFLASLSIFCVGLPVLTIMLEIKELSNTTTYQSQGEENKKYSKSPSPIFKIFAEYLFLISFIMTIQQNSSLINSVNNLYFDFKSFPLLQESSNAMSTVQSTFYYLSSSISNSFIILLYQAECLYNKDAELNTHSTASERLLALILVISVFNIGFPITYYFFNQKKLKDYKERMVAVCIGFYHYQVIFISVPMLEIVLTFPIDSGESVSLFEPYRAASATKNTRNICIGILAFLYILVPIILGLFLRRSHKRNTLYKKEVRIKYGIMYIHSKSNYYLYEILRIYCKIIILLIMDVPLMNILIKAMVILVVYVVYGTYLKFTKPFINPLLNKMVKLTTYVFIINLIILIVEMQVASVIMNEYTFLSVIDSGILWIYVGVFGGLALFFVVLNFSYFILFIYYSYRAFVPTMKNQVMKLKSLKEKIVKKTTEVGDNPLSKRPSLAQEMEFVQSVTLNSPQSPNSETSQEPQGEAELNEPNEKEYDDGGDRDIESNRDNEGGNRKEIFIECQSVITHAIEGENAVNSLNEEEAPERKTEQVVPNEGFYGEGESQGSEGKREREKEGGSSAKESKEELREETKWQVVGGKWRKTRILKKAFEEKREEDEAQELDNRSKLKEDLFTESSQV